MAWFVRPASIMSNECLLDPGGSLPCFGTRSVQHVPVPDPRQGLQKFNEAIAANRTLREQPGAPEHWRNPLMSVALALFHLGPICMLWMLLEPILEPDPCRLC